MHALRDVDFLARLELFSHFHEAQLAKLDACVSRHRHPPAVTLLQQEEDSHDAYIVRSGEVRVENDTPYGVFVLAELGAGEMFGETSFVDRGPRSSTVTTVTETELLGLSPLALAAAGEGDQRFELAVYWTFWKSLSRKLRATNERLARFFTQSGQTPSIEAAAAPVTGEKFRIGLAAKRQLFLEQKLSNMEINFLASLSKEEKLEDSQVIFREGDVGDTMFVVLAGRVMISKRIEGAGEEALAFLERGDYFGEMALIDRLPRSADAKAHQGGAVVLAIPRIVLEGILDIEKVSSRRLLRILCSLIAKRLRVLDEKIVGWFILAGGGMDSGEPG
jgi:CRP-like cAMP-binding protein